MKQLVVMTPLKKQSILHVHSEMSQVAIYRLFTALFEKVDRVDPRYDALADTMDLIWSGSWTKGNGLFDQELSEERLRLD